MHDIVADPAPLDEEPAGDLWRTPDYVLAPVREALGAIDLDPCSSAEANRTVRAAAYFTREQDGLARPWTCPDGSPARIHVNPPYSRDGLVSRAGLFLDRLIAQHAAGNVSAGIILVNVCAETAWFRPMWSLWLCFWRSRIHFEHPTKPPGSPKYASVLGYIGPHPDRFVAAFTPFGQIVPPAVPTPERGSTR